MADRIMKTDYFKLETPNRPGEGARVLKVLRDARVNLLAFTGFPKGRKTQMDFVPSNAAAFKKAMRRAGLPVSGKKTVFLIQGSDRVGSIHRIMEKLGKAGINDDNRCPFPFEMHVKSMRSDFDHPIGNGVGLPHAGGEH